MAAQPDSTPTRVLAETVPPASTRTVSDSYFSIPAHFNSFLSTHSLVANVVQELRCGLLQQPGRSQVIVHNRMYTRKVLARRRCRLVRDALQRNLQGIKRFLFAHFSTNCQAGRYNSQYARSSCPLCPGGRYMQYTGRTSCTSCPAGRYTSQYGRTLCAYTCAPGRYSPAGAKACTTCATGRYTSTYAQGSCALCAAGKYAYNAQKSCRSCPVGRYSKSGVNACT